VDVKKNWLARQLGSTMAWRIRNLLRWRFIWHLVQADLSRIVARVGLLGVTSAVGELFIVVHRKDGRVENLGRVSCQVVTTAFVNLLVDDLQASQAAFHAFKYHAMGTTGGSEAAGDIALSAEVETRGTGTQTEGATANIYKSVGTVTATTTRAIVEHGLFSASSGVTLMDRSVFTTINLASADSIEFTYQLTCTSGG
jgi:hypothetical protein